MRLLIITQKVDRRDPILGFFHRWLEELSKHCESITVIGQLAGEYNLPANISVHSLYKEKGWSRPRQILRFWILIWRLRKQYDVAFVHMTPIWVVLGWKIWFVTRKPIYLWYEIRRGGFILSLALLFVRKVFTATKDGLPFHSKKMVVTGHGIDTEFFRPPSEPREKGLVATVGRITAIKHLDLIIKTFAKLPSDHRLTIGGGTITAADTGYRKNLEDLTRSLGISDRVIMGFLSQEEVCSLLKRSEIFLHAAQGGLDKVVLEAMSSGCLIVSTSRAAVHVLPEECMADEQTITDKAKALLALSEAERERLGHDLRARVLKNHDLSKLAERLVLEMQSQ